MKSINKLLFFAISSIFLFACNNVDESKIEESKVLVELEDFNSKLLSQAKTKNGNRFLRFTAVASADLVGAYEGAKIGGNIGGRLGALFGGAKGLVLGALGGAAGGGLFCGVGASYTAHRTVSNEEVAVDFVDPNIMFAPLVASEIELSDDIEAVAIVFPEGYEHLKLAGYYHNIMLKALVDNNIEEAELVLKSESTEQNDNLEISDEGEVIDEVLYECVQQFREIEDDFNIIKENVKLAYRENSETIENVDLLFTFKEDNSLPKKTIKLFIELYTQYPENLQQVAYIVNEYIQKVYISNEYSKLEKEQIFLALSIAAYSPQFWMEQNF